MRAGLTAAAAQLLASLILGFLPALYSHVFGRHDPWSVIFPAFVLALALAFASETAFLLIAAPRREDGAPWARTAAAVFASWVCGVAAFLAFGAFGGRALFSMAPLMAWILAIVVLAALLPRSVRMSRTK